MGRAGVSLCTPPNSHRLCDLSRPAQSPATEVESNLGWRRWAGDGWEAWSLGSIAWWGRHHCLPAAFSHHGQCLWDGWPGTSLTPSLISGASPAAWPPAASGPSAETGPVQHWELTLWWLPEPGHHQPSPCPDVGACRRSSCSWVFSSRERAQVAAAGVCIEKMFRGKFILLLSLVMMLFSMLKN